MIDCKLVNSISSFMLTAISQLACCPVDHQHAVCEKEIANMLQSTEYVPKKLLDQGSKQRG